MDEYIDITRTISENGSCLLFRLPKEPRFNDKESPQDRFQSKWAFKNFKTNLIKRIKEQYTICSTEHLSDPIESNILLLEGCIKITVKSTELLKKE